MAGRAVKQVPLRRLLAKPVLPEAPADEPVSTLDMVRARDELTAAGLEVDLERLADMLADGRRLAPIPGSYLVPRGAGVAALGGAMTCVGAGLYYLLPAALEDLEEGAGGGGQPVPAMEPGMTAALAQVTWLAMLVGVLQLSVGLGMMLVNGGFKMPAIGGALRAEDALLVLHRHVDAVRMEPAALKTVQRAKSAVRAIEKSEVWHTDLFDSHRVRVNLDEELEQVTSRMRRLTSIQHGDAERGGAQDALVAEILESTNARVDALQAYEAQVRDCDRDLRRLAAAESREVNATRLVDLAARTGADQTQRANIEQLTSEARMAAESLREVLALMAGTAESLTSTK